MEYKIPLGLHHAPVPVAFLLFLQSKDDIRIDTGPFFDDTNRTLLKVLTKEVSFNLESEIVNLKKDY